MGEKKNPMLLWNIRSTLTGNRIIWTTKYLWGNYLLSIEGFKLLIRKSSHTENTKEDLKCKSNTHIEITVFKNTVSVKQLAEMKYWNISFVA